MSWFSAHPFPPRQARALYVLASAAIATSAPLYAQTVPPAPHPDEQDLPITIRAEDISGRPDRQLDLKRDVELTRGQTRLTADTGSPAGHTRR